MRVLLTGATGLIGGELLDALPAGWDVVAVARAPGPQDIEWLAADLTEPDLGGALPERLDAVVHLAQGRGYRDFPACAAELVGVNVGATSQLLQHAVRAGAKRFVLASTATVYRTSHAPLAEDAPLRARSAYATSKRAAELLVEPYRDLMACRTLRIFTAYGAVTDDRLVADLVDRVRTGRAVEIQGEQGLVISPVHAADAARAVAAAVEAPVPPGAVDVVNIGGPPMGIRAVAEGIGRALGAEPVLARRPGPEPGGYSCDGAKAATVLGLDELIGFEEGIARSFARVGT